MGLKIKSEKSFEEAIEIELQSDIQVIESQMHKIARELNNPEYVLEIHPSASLKPKLQLGLTYSIY